MPSLSARAVQIKYRRTRLPFPSPVCYGPHPMSHVVLVSSLVSFFTPGTSCLVRKAKLRFPESSPLGRRPFKRIGFQLTRFELTTDRFAAGPSRAAGLLLAKPVGTTVCVNSSFQNCPLLVDLAYKTNFCYS